MECCKASQFSNDAGARIWQAADVGYLALQYGAWLTWACLTLQLSSHLVPLLLQESSHLVPLLLQESSHLVPLLLQESSLHFLSFFVKTFLVYNYRASDEERILRGLCHTYVMHYIVTFITSSDQGPAIWSAGKCH